MDSTASPIRVAVTNRMRMGRRVVARKPPVASPPAPAPLSAMPIAMLPERGVVEVTGEDRAGFLQGLVSNDVERARPGQAVWAALLTPQGKWVADFFVFPRPRPGCWITSVGTPATPLRPRRILNPNSRLAHPGRAMDG
ncbi:hypothetical protein J4558_26775 [Leptolyngbya sp. 15MV]|nr:hypothetical protein J4558_26775 [Leptolyngbya sp. 15MV]